MRTLLTLSAAAALGNAIYFVLGVLFMATDEPRWRGISDVFLWLTGFCMPPLAVLQWLLLTPVLCLLLMLPGYFVYTRLDWASAGAFVLVWGVASYGIVWLIYLPFSLLCNA